MIHLFALSVKGMVKKKMNKKKELAVGVVFLMLGLGMLFMSFAMQPVIENDIGPGFLPKIVGIGFMVLSVMKLILTFAGQSHEAGSSGEKPAYGKGFLTVVIFTMYVLTFKSLGFLISSTLYLFIEITLLKYDGENMMKGLKSTGLIALLVPAIVYFFFTGVLDLVLPAGILG